MLRVLISNDDGYQAPGLKALYEAVSDIAIAEVVAPEFNNSAKSNAITINQPLYVSTDAITGFRYVNGTPADSVHLALTGLLDYTPDLILSGINNGANMGDDTIYSGTVGAAMEGYLFGIPSIAFSQAEKGWRHLDAAVLHIRKLLQIFTKKAFINGQPWLFNVNIPCLPYEDIKSYQVCRLGRRHASEPVVKQKNPAGQMMYWIGNAGKEKDASVGTDFHALQNGHIAITPLQIDLTDHQHLQYWAQSFKSY